MNDFFTEDEIKATQEEIQKREQEFGGDKREKMSHGVYDLTFCLLEAESTSPNVQLVKLTYNVDADRKKYRDLPKIFKFDSNDPEKLKVNKRLFQEHFYKGFGYTLKAGDLKSVINQVKQFEEKRLRAAVQVKQKIYKKFKLDKDGNKTGEIQGYKIFDQAEIWFVGRIDEDIRIKPEKRFVPLTEKEKMEYMDHRSQYPERYDENGNLKFDENTTDGEETENTAAGANSTESFAAQLLNSNNGSSAEELPWEEEAWS